MKARYEQFGGIVGTEAPPMLAYVDREYMRELGLADSALWQGDINPNAHLAAPTEVHLTVTNRCNLDCGKCYMTSGPDEPDGLSTEDLKKTIDELAAMGVFHIAMGGGEATLREDLFELAAYAREKGIVPNLTTNGFYVRESNVEQFRVFGQVNCSMDGTRDVYDARGIAHHWDAADRALRLLVSAGVTCGINCVVSRACYENLDEMVSYAARIGLHDIELLRYKPVGRGVLDYQQHRLTDAQHREIFPRVLELSQQHDVFVKMDCSFTPMVAWHDPGREMMSFYGVIGCDGGNMLAATSPDGSVKSCSFASGGAGQANELRSIWDGADHFREYRDWPDHAPAPCSSCKYLDICKGGCHVVADHVCGTIFQSDPECPRVLEHGPVSAFDV